MWAIYFLCFASPMFQNILIFALWLGLFIFGTAKRKLLVVCLIKTHPQQWVYSLKFSSLTQFPGLLLLFSLKYFYSFLLCSTFLRFILWCKVVIPNLFPEKNLQTRKHKNVYMLPRFILQYNIERNNKTKNIMFYLYVCLSATFFANWLLREFDITPFKVCCPNEVGARLVTIKIWLVSQPT